MRAHELGKAGLDSHQAEAVLDFIAGAELTRSRGYRLDGEPYRIETKPGVVEVYLVNDAERVSCVHVAPDAGLVEV